MGLVRAQRRTIREWPDNDRCLALESARRLFTSGSDATNTALGVWRLFADLNLEEAKKTRFRTMHDCFTRELKDGARPIDPEPSVLVCPCDAIVGAAGRIEGTTLIQAKGFPYTLHDLLGDSELVRVYRDGCYVTLRITSSMYHRFHAPHDCRVKQVTYIRRHVERKPDRAPACREAILQE
jgi:phosphatidylserine decarboxylase